MFNSLKGIISGKRIDSLFIENNGLEWKLDISEFTSRELPPVGEQARVYLYLIHREDHMSLCGFASEEERTLFIELISVSGVGPKGALKILSGISVARFVEFLENEDVKGLTKLPGLGTKTAQKIILQLKGKLVAAGDEKEESGKVDESVKEIIESLGGMGFDKKLCRSVVSEIIKDHLVAEMNTSEREREIIRRAIVTLSSGGIG